MESLSGLSPKPELGPWESEARGDSRAAPPFHIQEIFTTGSAVNTGAERGREFEATGRADVCDEERVDRHGRTGQAASVQHKLGTPILEYFSKLHFLDNF